MADTKHAHSAIPVEGDGVSYPGIGWFLVVLIVTVLGCEIFVWGLFKASERYRLQRPEVVRAPLAAPAATPSLVGGRLDTGLEQPPMPALLVNEPMNLKAFRAEQDQAVESYGWVNEAAQTVRLPIDRAKELVLEAGLPARQAPAPAPFPGAALAGSSVAPASAPTTAAAPATPHATEPAATGH